MVRALGGGVVDVRRERRLVAPSGYAPHLNRVGRFVAAICSRAYITFTIDPCVTSNYDQRVRRRHSGFAGGQIFARGAFEWLQA